MTNNTHMIVMRKAMWVSYTNYRGETGTRRISPRSLRFGASEFHPEPQWLLTALDLERDVEREFALKDMKPKPL